jgi:hypothetical protein
MDYHRMKKHLIFAVGALIIVLVIYLGIKDIPLVKKENDFKQEEIQKLKTQLFDCESPAKENTCTLEEIEDISKKLHKLQGNNEPQDNNELQNDDD